MTSLPPTIAVAFLARGEDAACYSAWERFLNSYRQHCPGVDHSLYVIFTGFANARALDEAKRLFGGVRYQPVLLRDDRCGIGACIELASRIHEDLICVLDTPSEILADDWLRKLAVNLALPNVALVGATGSYESPSQLKQSSPMFPNPHIRLNAFMTDREALRSIGSNQVFAEPLDALHFESGRQSLTRQILAMGRDILLVGRNGRGYSPMWWPTSDTSFQGTQSNLLVADDQTRGFAALRWPAKRAVALSAWGSYIREEQLMVMTQRPGRFGVLGRKSPSRLLKMSLGNSVVNGVESQHGR